MEDLVGNSDFDKQKAWSLTTQILALIFSDMHEVCWTILTSQQPKDPDSVCMWILWGVFRTQDVMQGYMDAQFQDHPSVSSEYVKFLCVNSGTETVKKLEDKFDKLQDKHTALLD
ncbi:hypothetical protein ACA910_019312 [Epithemia clementina (nom. ined.)]